MPSFIIAGYVWQILWSGGPIHQQPQKSPSWIGLINCKIELSLKQIENCVLFRWGTATTFKITDTKLYVPIVTLKTEDNTKLSKLLSDGFRRSIYWNKYKVTDNILVEIAIANEEKYIRELHDSSYQGVKRLFLLAYNYKDGDNHVSVDSFKKYFLPRVKITLMVEIFIISQLMTQLNNTTKLEKYQQDKVLKKIIFFWKIL